VEVALHFLRQLVVGDEAFACLLLLKGVIVVLVLGARGWGGEETGGEIDGGHGKVRPPLSLLNASVFLSSASTQARTHARTYLSVR